MVTADVSAISSLLPLTCTVAVPGLPSPICKFPGTQVTPADRSRDKVPSFTVVGPAYVLAPAAFPENVSVPEPIVSATLYWDDWNVVANVTTYNASISVDSGFTWLWAEGGKALDCMLWPIARSAADLLTEGPLAAIRLCEGRDCGWLFLDTSRNRTRRWCDMRICGNRAKARRHHERVKTGAA